MSLSQIELVLISIRVEWECFWVNLREDNKVSESKMPVSQCQHGRIQGWLPSSSWIRMNEFESDWISLGQSFVQNGWIQNFKIQDGRILDGCHLQVNQIELVWFRVRVEWECFWVNLREDNKVSESKMAEIKIAAIINLNQNEWVKLFVQNGWILGGRIQDGRIQDGCHHQFESEWMSEVFLCKTAEANMAEFKMVAFFKLSKNEWVWVRLN